jgi:CheY-like chemotaxis protein
MCFYLAALAQAPDAGPAAEKPAAEKKTPPAAAKAATKAPAAKAATGGKAGTAGKAANLAPPEDPVVTALLTSNPTTPSDIFRTAQLLLDAGRPELAKRFLQKLLDAKLDDDQWTALVNEFHTPTLTDLAARTELRPQSEQLIHAALSAVNRRLLDPARLAAEIKQLQDPSPEVRAKALESLQGAHGVGMNALIAVLADPQRAAEHAAVRAALVAMRGDAIDPLADILDRAEPELIIQAIETLAQMRATQATAYLLVPALSDRSDPRVRAAARGAVVELLGRLPNKAWAAQQLDDLARRYFAGKQSMRVDVDGRATLWTWDAEKRQCVPRNCAPDDAARAVAARLARAARSLASDNFKVQVLSLATALDQIVYDRGLDKRLDFNDPAIREIAALNPSIIEAVLAFCLAERHPAAARAAAEILGRTGTAQSLLRGGSEPSPLVRAARSPDRRLRMAALDSIAALQPQSPFAGSSQVMESLGYLAASSGGRRALAVSPIPGTLEEWIGVLKFRNIACDLAASGREAVSMALHGPDYELVVIDMATQSPPAEEIVQEIRQDYRTASLRIALVARAGFLKRAERIAEEDPLSIAFSQPLDAAAARWQLSKLMELTPPEFVGFSERQNMAVRALDCLAKLASTSGELYDMHRVQDAVLTGLLVPRLSSHAVAVLANLGTSASQKALVDLASRSANPLELRSSAAKALDFNVQRFGLLLNQDAIREQYVRYNKSSSQDAATQQVLASTLNTIESRAAPSILEAAQKAAAQKLMPPKRPVDKAQSQK